MSNHEKAQANRFRFRAWDTRQKKLIDLYKFTPLALDADLKQDGIFIPFADNLILMQSTGLLDKNGKEIFEGDLIKESLGRMKTVEYFKDGFWLNGTTKGATFTLRNEHKNCEVIGNIYEHSHLLNGQEV